MGLVGYYSRFIPNCAAIARPLTDLTKGGKPNVVEWGPAQEAAFSTLKKRLAVEPILRLPDPDRPYILRTDASDVGVGAERECLALVWAVHKFYIYLYGKEFLLETDHHPLVYINKTKVSNSRVMRWALALQPYRFVIKAIKGADNVGADFLSRCGV
ncbi:hypothetical protein BSL78_00004 [Apostichopus japonicus]|uniref:Reverse transcriptase RNase H-like domain-containing protein n=1 Tax=Stichopus japonicus TaxID=307972 RepID=A0A2G8LRU9_STIJA|nr:hypothetical protein BSL78_00004 [Apostichopus japonicus]